MKFLFLVKLMRNLDELFIILEEPLCVKALDKS